MSTGWLGEAIVDFLKGPMYTMPLMSFIDQECMIFTPEDENKFQYTTAHNDFKELVDSLLTDFLGELGVSPEEFYAQVSQAQDADQLTMFVVQTILTVDDFMMFKAMMVKRNLDLTNQVLAAFESGGDMDFRDDPPPAQPRNQEEADLMEKTLEMSRSLQQKSDRADGVKKAMRALQVQDEDDALAVALAASLRDGAFADTELADINQAIALSMAMESERQRMLLEMEAAALRAALASRGAEFDAELARLRALLAARGATTDGELSALRAALEARGFDKAEAELGAIRASLFAQGSSVDSEIAALKAALAKRGTSGKAAEDELGALKAALAAKASDPAVAAARAEDGQAEALCAALTAKDAEFGAEMANLRSQLSARDEGHKAEVAALRAALAGQGFDAAEAELAALRAALAAKSGAVEGEIAGLKAALARRSSVGPAANVQLAALAAALAAKAADPAVSAAQAKDAASAAAAAPRASFTASSLSSAPPLSGKAASASKGSSESYGAGSGPTKGGAGAAKGTSSTGASGSAPAAAGAAASSSSGAGGFFPVIPPRGVNRSASTSGRDADGSPPTSPSAAYPGAEGLCKPGAVRKAKAEEPSYETAAVPDFKAVNAVRSKAAGYKSSGPDTSGNVSLESIRAAAQAAAATAKNIAAAGGQDQKEWLEQQKVRLVAAKKAERDAEMEQYMLKMANKERGRGGGQAAASTAPPSDADAKRAALREKLASKMLQDMMQKGA